MMEKFVWEPALVKVNAMQAATEACCLIVKRAIKNHMIVGGGGATEMEVSAYLHRFADTKITHKQQAIFKSFARALEVVPRQLCDNAGFDSTDILNKLRVEHR